MEQTPQSDTDQAFRSTGVGPTLKAAREKTGKSLAEVATMLRIRQPYLLALEEGRHRDLPGGTYAIGFLRTYGDFLGLDGEEMVRRFRAEAAGDLHSRSELIFPSPVSEGRVPGGAILFLGLMFAAIAYGAWYWLSARDMKVAELVPNLPDRLSGLVGTQEAAKTMPPAPKPDEPPAATPAAPASSKDSEVVPPSESDDDAKAKAEPAKPEPAKVEPGKPEKAKTEPAKPEKGKPEPAKPEIAKPEPAKVEQAKAEPAKPTAEPPAESPTLKMTSQDSSGSRVTLTATGDDCWVQVREMDGQLLMSRLLRKGDSYSVPNRPGLTLMVGNAGALDVSVDGKKAPSLGSSGMVRRDIRLDPDKLLTGG
ncbi:Protein conserved in bacteria [Magnetospirillum sp. LM-5]|uniref:helix-turn-helix domain-containing protein n=1 Tax=Magnetospirillum sp. LM-5 TaxID=2681466 RepID=UPI001381B4C6|nr:RodZ domain-containing protein [Magnetospirillum sp. LM-5]CAA7625066.1 Protein conserved in bacteria [Magnetospirillum sp. LM-5]